ncbi:MAG TPA: hypothetical protein PKN56_11870 [Leptospiraceae bacterium]|nr:hypothetical protein [Leptospiraceae bacterium]
MSNCYFESFSKNSRYIVSSLSKGNLILFFSKWSNQERNYLCPETGVNFPKVDTHSILFSKGTSVLLINSDSISTLNLTSETAAIESPSGVRIIRNKFYFQNYFYSYYCDNINTVQDVFPMQDMTGYLSIQSVSTKKVVISFFKSGRYLLYLETGDPNFNPTDIYAVME